VCENGSPKGTVDFDALVAALDANGTGEQSE
jgi:hypothetical protein